MDGLQYRFTLSVSEQDQLGSLERWLAGVDTAIVRRHSGEPGTGELGALDVLSVMVGSGGLVALSKVLPEFLRARRAGIRIEAEVAGEKFSIEVTNADAETRRMVERLLGGGPGAGA
ncbi:effector-associated constant component EACC1 [Catenulispora subtropica]|uniref:Uncharacterized protein n=1 Tax=Catenulispora subtropica TaxID=450798 RepID=A0ABP5C5Y0_9ACTN